MNPHRELGRRLAAVGDRYLEETPPSDVVRTRVLHRAAEMQQATRSPHRAQNQPSAKSPGWWSVATVSGLAAVATAVIVVAISWPDVDGTGNPRRSRTPESTPPPPSLTAQRGADVPDPTVAAKLSARVERGRDEPLRLGDAVEAGAHPTTVVFTDGSRVALKPGGSLRLTHLDTHGAAVRLDQGQVSVAVTHAPQTQWQFHAGPYVVHVIGTRFDLGWEADTWSLSMHEGIVEVEGPDFPRARFVAGEQLVRRLEPPSDTSALVDDVRGLRGAGSGDARARARRPGGPSARGLQAAIEAPLPEAKAEAEADSWWVLAGLGATDAAATLLVRDYLDHAHDLDWGHASAAVLWRLGVHVRRDHPDLFETICRQIRMHHPSSDAAAPAAYELGVMTASDRPAEAARWFATFLSEAPDSKLAPMAAGRWLEAIRLLDDRDSQRAAAREYLKRFPAGSHRAVAEALLHGEGEGP